MWTQKDWDELRKMEKCPKCGGHILDDCIYPVYCAVCYYGYPEVWVVMEYKKTVNKKNDKNG